MIKIFTKLLIIIFILNIYGFKYVSASNEYDTYFVVSAYYSPLPNQTHYLMGSYEKEIRLNGKGIKGASNKNVFSGMLAAPKKYKFGTKIKLEGLGIGSVEDRGGAIVPAGVRGYSYDRIDIWMGYGEEGLKRALTWGKRTVKGKILTRDTKTTINIKKQPALKSSLKRLKRKDNIFLKGIGIRSNKNDIIKLQTFLSEIGFYKGKINGIYNKELINNIYDFQIKNKLIKNGQTYGAGYWGKTTRKKIMTMYYNGDFNTKETNNTKTSEYKYFTYNIGEESSKEKIKELQTIFKKLGKYKGKINGDYSYIKDILIRYQLENKLINNRNNRGAGYFGPKTRKIAEKDYKIVLEKEKIEKQKRIELAKIKKEVIKKVDKHLSQIGNPKKGEIGTHVRILQKTLKTLGHFNVKDSAIFGNITEKSILSYQIDKGIIKDKNSKGAGIYGPATKESIKKDLINKLLELRLKEKDLVAMK